MDSIVLRVPELKKLVGLLVKEHMDYVEIVLSPGDASGGITLPPSAVFTAFRSAVPFELVDYDELEGVPEAEADFKTL